MFSFTKKKSERKDEIHLGTEAVFVSSSRHPLRGPPLNSLLLNSLLHFLGSIWEPTFGHFQTPGSILELPGVVSGASGVDCGALHGRFFVILCNRQKKKGKT